MTNSQNWPRKSKKDIKNFVKKKLVKNSPFYEFNAFTTRKIQTHTWKICEWRQNISDYMSQFIALLGMTVWLLFPYMEVCPALITETAAIPG